MFLRGNPENGNVKNAVRQALIFKILNHIRKEVKMFKNLSYDQLRKTKKISIDRKSYEAELELKDYERKCQEAGLFPEVERTPEIRTYAYSEGDVHGEFRAYNARQTDPDKRIAEGHAK
jgi:hypothetical protein